MATDDAFPLPGVTAIQTVADWEAFFHAASASGVIADSGSQLAPSLDVAGRRVAIAAGAAMVRAFYKPVTSTTYTAIPAASSQNRIDRLVLRLNRASTASASFVVPTVITGTPAASPQVPALTRTSAGLWDLPIAHWTSASNGSLSGLVDERIMTSSVVSMSSAGGTPALDRAGLLIQPDTGTLLMSTAAGAAWKTVWVPDTWHSAGDGTNGWTASAPPGSYFYYKMIFPGIVAVTFRFSMKGGTGKDGTQILASALPAAYRPASTKEIIAYADMQAVTNAAGNNQQSVISVHADGTVTSRGFANPATVASGNGVYPLDSPY